MTVTDIVGEQEIKNGLLHFMHRVTGPRGVEVKIAAHSTSVLRCFTDIDALIDALPKWDGRSVQQLKRDIAIDSRSGFGEHYEDAHIVAYAGKSPLDKPVVKARINGMYFFYMHPDIERMVKRCE